MAVLSFDDFLRSCTKTTRTHQGVSISLPQSQVPKKYLLSAAPFPTTSFLLVLSCFSSSVHPVCSSEERLEC